MPISMPSPTTDAVSSTSSEGNNLDFEVKISSSRTTHFSNQNDLNDLSQNLALQSQSTSTFFTTQIMQFAQFVMQDF